MYICEFCKYTTNDSGNYSKHKQTKKHIEKELLNKSVEKENEVLKQQIKEMEFQYKHKLELLEKENEKLEEVNKILKEQSAKTINNTQNNTINIGSINYVNEHFKDAPPLERITDFIINGIDTNDVSQHDKFIEDIIYHHNNKMLHQLIGDHIVSVYKKTDMNKQSFHTTDTSRLNYVVRVLENSIELSNENENDNHNNYYEDSDSEDDRYNYINEETLDDDHRQLIIAKKEYEKYMKRVEKKKELQLIKTKEMENNKKIWITDKNGYKICKLLIDPTISQLVNILKRKLKNKSNKKIKIDNLDKELKYHNSINIILESIDIKKLKTEVNKYIAPKFNLDKKKN